MEQIVCDLTLLPADWCAHCKGHALEEDKKDEPDFLDVLNE